MITVAHKVGRLVEVRIFTPVTVEEIVSMAQQIGLAASVCTPRHIVGITDLRGANLFRGRQPIEEDVSGPQGARGVAGRGADGHRAAAGEAILGRGRSGPGRAQPAPRLKPIREPPRDLRGHGHDGHLRVYPDAGREDRSVGHEEPRELEALAARVHDPAALIV
jgi:hypothetical protein